MLLDLIYPMITNVRFHFVHKPISRLTYFYATIMITLVHLSLFMQT